ERLQIYSSSYPQAATEWTLYVTRGQPWCRGGEMTMIRAERKYIEILRILKEHQDPVGAKRLSELMAERGFILSDRAVQYYLSYLDTMGFTEKVGNQGRILTLAG